jgi:hypothetical protein
VTVPGLATEPMSPWSVKRPRFPSARAAQKAERKTRVPRSLKVVEFIMGDGITTCRDPGRKKI